MCETLVITGESQISGRMAHFGITSPKVMLSRNPGVLPNTLSIGRCDQISRIGMRRIQVDWKWEGERRRAIRRPSGSHAAGASPPVRGPGHRRVAEKSGPNLPTELPA